MGKPGDWPGDGTPAEEGGGAAFDFSEAYPLSWSPGVAVAWAQVVSGGWRGCCRWIELVRSSGILRRERG